MSTRFRLTEKRPYYGWVLMVVLGITTIISYGTTQYLFGGLSSPICIPLSGMLVAQIGWRATLIVLGLPGISTSKRCAVPPSGCLLSPFPW